MTTLLLFFLLQFCDAGTTLLFLRRGVMEANPLVRYALQFPAHPAVVLLLLKAAACGLAYYAWRSQRTILLRRVNLLFGLCVAWNLAAIALT